MKLLSCYIENYGKISQKKIEFDGGINSYCEANGYGKTTLCSFIKAMFYGLKGYNDKTREFCDRKHFYPFSANRFGGNIIFESDGKIYRIERFFGEKSETADEMTVYVGGEITTELGEIPGEKVFGLDKESFERAVFVDNSDIEISSTAGIKAKLGAYFYGDDVNVENALKILEDAAKDYKKSKKAQDLISLEKANNDKLNAEVKNRRDIKNSLPQKYDEYENTLGEIALLEEKLSEAAKANETFAVWENYERMVNSIAEQEQKLAAIRESFKAGVLSDEDISELEKQTSELNRLNILKSEKISRPLSAKQRTLKEKFGDNRPSEEELGELDEQMAEYKTALKEYNAAPEYTFETISEPVKNNGGYLLPIFFACIAVTAVGAVLLFFSRLIGCIVSAVGVIGTAISLTALLQSKKKPAPQKTEQVKNPEKEIKKERLDNVYRPIEGFLSGYGYSGNGIETDHKLFLSDLNEYDELLREEREQKREIGEIDSQMQRLKGQIDSTFLRCGIQTENYSAEIKNIKEKTSEIRFTENELSAKRKQAENYKAEKNVTGKPSGEAADVESIRELLKVKYDKKSIISKDIDSAEWAAEQLDYYVSEKRKSDEKLEEYKKTHFLLTTAAEFLKESEKKITEKYVKPIKDELVKYSDIFEKAIGEKIYIDKNYEISFDEGGKLRSEKYLSSGQRSVLALCFRLAIFANMYQDNPPFLILDDPFVSLDEENMDKAKGVLKDLSSSLQIIYFTCHESRKL